MSGLSSLTSLRMEFINDVHARWMPIQGPNSGLCLPQSLGADPADTYVSTCQSTSLGGVARMVTHMDNLAASDDANTGIIRLIVGDEFQGTPLFTLPELDNYDASAGYGDALGVYDDWAFHTTTGKSHKVIGSYLTIGNHEFDTGVDVLNNYLNDISAPGKDMDNNATPGATVLCANCNFGVSGCPVDHTKLSPYAKVEGLFSGNKTLGIWGMTVPALHAVANLPTSCPMKSHAAVKSDFTQFLTEVDHAVIISHMGIEEDIKFADTMRDIDANLKAKVLGIYGGHSHSVICGQNGHDTVNGGTVVDADASLGDIAHVNCEDGTGFDPAVQAIWDSGAYTEVSGAKLPNYPSVTAGFPIYHNSMHSWVYADMTLKPDGTSTHRQSILDSSIPLDPKLINSQEPEIEALVAAQKDKIANARGTLDSGTCKIGHTGCDGGSFYATASVAAGVHYVLPEIINDETIMDGSFPVGSIINGGSVRAALPDGELSWVDINTTFPFLNNLVGGKIKGENIIVNMMHGAIGHGGGQFAGLRIVHSDDFDMEAYRAVIAEDAAKLGLQQATYFCDAANPIYRHTGAHPLNGKRHYFPSALMNKMIRERSATEPERTKTVPTGEGCASTSQLSESGLAFEINTCLASHLRHVRSGALEPVDYFPHSSVNQCGCWEQIDPEKDYYIIVADFIANGGDMYCLEFSERFDYSASFGGEVGCTGVAMDFIDNFQSNLYPLVGEGYQWVSESTAKGNDATPWVGVGTAFLSAALLW